MSDTQGTAPVEQEAAPAAEEAYTPHPAWDQALATIADPLRGPIYKQIQETEREHQKALEQARQGSVEPQWREFTDLAKGANVDPATLIEAYNVRQNMLNDPQGFYQRLKTEIDAAVASGALTPAEGAAATQQANQQQAAAGDVADMKTPEQEQLERLQAQFDQMTAQQQQQYQAQVEAQQEQEAQVYYSDFNATVNKKFADAGYVDAQGNLTVKPESIVAVMRMADSALGGDISDTLTLQQAVDGAFNALMQFAGQQGATPQTAQRQTPPPVGGGRGVAAPEAQSFTNDLAGKKARINAMLEEGQRQAAAGITDL